MQRLLLALLCVAVLGLGGCIVLPVPIPASGTRVDREALKLVIGETRRDDVHALVGPPNALQSDFNEIWELERDPFHSFWFVAVGAYGGGVGGDFRTGKATRYILHVSYDSTSRVRSWRWIADDGRSQASGEAAPSPPPPAPLKRLKWQADHVVIEPGGTLLGITVQPNQALAIQRRQLTTGDIVAEFGGRLDGCGAPMRFAMIDQTLVSIPMTLAAGSLPCRWSLPLGEAVAGTPINAFAVGPVPLAAQLAAGLVLHDDQGGGVGIFRLSGERLARVPPQASIMAAAAGGTTLLLRTLDGAVGNSRYWHFDLAGERLVEIGALRQPFLRGPCSFGPIAVSPDGRIAAVFCVGHVQIWTMTGNGSSFELVTILPVPPGATGPDLAFTPDGSRLVLGPHGIVVWRIADEVIEALLAPHIMPPEEVGDQVVPIADGTRIATPAGLWQRAGDAAAAHSARP